MKIPKYIEKALRNRTIAAGKFLDADYAITKFICKYHIIVEEYDYNTGCETLANPSGSEERIRKAILNHK